MIVKGLFRGMLTYFSDSLLLDAALIVKGILSGMLTCYSYSCLLGAFLFSTGKGDRDSGTSTLLSSLWLFPLFDDSLESSMLLNVNPILSASLYLKFS